MWWKNELSDSLHRILSEQRPEKTCRKNPSREKNLAGNLGRIHDSCSEKPILRRLHGWKVFAHIYKKSIPTKGGQTLNNLRKRKQAKKPPTKTF